MTEQFQPFTSEEHQSFTSSLHKIDGSFEGDEWEKISRTLESRSSKEVMIHAYRYLVALQAMVPRDVVHSLSEELTGDLWSLEEELIFEQSIAVFQEDDPKRWEKIASLFPKKNAQEVELRYQNLLFDINRIQLGEHVLVRVKCGSDSLKEAQETGNISSNCDPNITTPDGL
eukprot:CAMPEP_0185781590 /NCGR_PEP_ID=MMETSP1174-20130828/102976_1 /TAXON_ID=35687 /ORGANISM="Dictyocha speculum, Strain CCMP1381" /LENGTH=171 /DNA_ID=CAMNT_0028471639 /DNA_START=12 /DNA_END=527 /DNA_ORIENTATION=+